MNEKYADKVIERTLKSSKKLGARDRRFIAETIYEVVRWYRLLENMAGGEDFWRIVGLQFLRQGYDLPAWPEFAELDYGYLQRAMKKASTEFAVEQSIPDWLDRYGRAEFGGEWESIMKALNKPAEVFLRVNALKATPEEVIKSLATEETVAVPVPEVSASTLRLKDRKNIFSTNAFREGFFEIQDAASQMIVPLLDIQPGLRVVDACAGAGGKSLHMASLMKNKGRIISMDIHEWKLNELKLRARRDGVDTIETRVIDSQKVIKRMEEQADRLLLDVPCTGVGVLRRNPDAKWKIDPTELDRLCATQYEILSTYASMTKKGGKMVYATCSLFPRENEKQVERFMNEFGKDWTLVKQLHLRPDVQGFDGFYAALFERNK